MFGDNDILGSLTSYTYITGEDKNILAFNTILNVTAG